MVKNSKGRRKGNLKKKKNRNKSGNRNGNRKRQRLKVKTKHHIVPKSRGGNGRRNVVSIDSKKHELYHRLFDDLVPEEIIKVLSEIFWGKNYEITIKER